MSFKIPDSPDKIAKLSEPRSAGTTPSPIIEDFVNTQMDVMPRYGRDASGVDSSIGGKPREWTVLSVPQSHDGDMLNLNKILRERGVVAVTEKLPTVTEEDPSNQHAIDA